MHQGTELAAELRQHLQEVAAQLRLSLLLPLPFPCLVGPASASSHAREPQKLIVSEQKVITKPFSSQLLELALLWP